MAVSVATEAYNAQVSQLTRLSAGNVTTIILDYCLCEERELCFSSF